jgi:hypothetical protein
VVVELGVGRLLELKTWLRPLSPICWFADSPELMIRPSMSIQLLALHPPHGESELTGSVKREILPANPALLDPRRS